MRQLITRVDDQLLEDLKARARAEHRSVNALVNQILADAVRTMDRRREIAVRMAALGLSVDVIPSLIPPTMDELREMTRGSGPIATDALSWVRGDR